MVIAETLTEILRRSDLRAARAALCALAPELHIDGPQSPPAPSLAALPSFVPTGVIELGAVTDAAVCAKLVGAITSLVERGLPGVLVYAYDETWAIGAELLARLPGHAMVEDAWAFHVVPGRAGWPAHRGVSHVVLDRDRPEIVDTWVALSDASIDRSCMHVVPLDDDAAYPARLDSVAAEDGRARALPVAAGTALAWNANVLHWGGACAADAVGPRTSCTFTLVRVGDEARFGAQTVRPDALPFAERLDLVAAQIARYGEGQPDISAEILEWARASCALRAISRP